MNKADIDIIEGIILEGTSAEQKVLFGFDAATSIDMIVKKFFYFGRGKYPRFFRGKSAPFHQEMVVNMVKSYLGKNFLNIAYRGSAKTTLAKLFVTFVLLNDLDEFRKYIKILTKDGKNSKQIVTDVYNLIVEVRDVYGDIFENDSDIKREETMSSFTTKTGRKLSAGTVGQTQRGHIQDAYRPDWLWFDDIEDRESIASIVITQGIMGKCSEAIDGLAKNGSYLITANYISDQGTVQWFRNKPSVSTQITPILDDFGVPTWSIYSKEEIAKIKADADDFYGEFMCDPKRSENKFFDIERIERDMKLAREPKRESAGVKYFIDYLPHHRFAQGSDHSDGIGLDANTLAGFDFTTGELAYTYANNLIAPDLAAHEFARIGAEYGNCLYAPEVNNKCGGIVLATLKEIPYKKLYTQIVDDKIFTQKTEKLGWETNGKTKRKLLFDFKKDYNDGFIKIYDKNVLHEMKAYTNNDIGEGVSLVTRHFDLLMAVMIAWQMKDYVRSTERKREESSEMTKEEMYSAI